ncbi:MAG: hypothetical protein ACOCRK_06230 [bacterium]
MGSYLIESYDEENDFSGLELSGEIIRDEDMIEIAKQDIRMDFINFMSDFFDRVMETNYVNKLRTFLLQDLRTIFNDYNKLTINELKAVIKFEIDLAEYHNEDERIKQLQMLIDAIEELY